MITIPRTECVLNRDNRSHELARRGLLECAHASGWIMVHGEITVRGVTRKHAWLEHEKAGIIYCPVSDSVEQITRFRRVYGAGDIARYTPAEVRKLYVTANCSGPWHDKRHGLTHAEVLHIFSYDHRTGELIRRRRCSGKVAGSTSASHGYRTILANGAYYLAHRLVWLHQYGEWPALEIDHIDRNKLNNRVGNLRDVPESVNKANHSDETPSGLPRGVRRSGARYFAQLGSNYLGTFDTPNEAHEAFKAAHVNKFGVDSRYCPANPKIIAGLKDLLHPKVDIPDIEITVSIVVNGEQVV